MYNYNCITHIPPMPKDYDPWSNGAASFFDGGYYLDSYEVGIVSCIAMVFIECADGYSGKRFLRVDNPDELIKKMCWRWENSCETPDDCVSFVISHCINPNEYE